MMITHRGKDLGPENSMKGMKGSVATKLDGIEADVWLNGEGIPMVLHGSDLGTLEDFGYPGERLFEWSTENLTSE